MSLRSLSAPSLNVAPRALQLAGVGSAVIEGIGIHTGRHFEVTFRAGTPRKGLNFRVHYRDDECVAPALWTRLSGTTRSTALVLRGERGRRVEVRTIEHLLAALWTLGNPDLDISIRALDGDAESTAFEIPILDGSAERWMGVLASRPDLFRAHDQKFLRAWRVEAAFALEDGDKSVAFAPGALSEPICRLRVGVDFGEGLRHETTFVADWSRPAELSAAFAREIAPARTFGFQSELNELKRRGLARGGSLDNAILLDNSGGQARVVNVEGLRYPDELARHKLLDAVGDFALLGAPLLGDVTIIKAGHSLHLQALKDAIHAGALVSGHLDLETGAFFRDDG